MAARADRPDLAVTQDRRQDDEDEDALTFLQPSTKPGSLGRLGHYEVLEVIGRGGFGVVLKAFDERLHRVVAVKVLAPRLAATSPARKRFSARPAPSPPSVTRTSSPSTPSRSSRSPTWSWSSSPGKPSSRSSIGSARSTPRRWSASAGRSPRVWRRRTLQGLIHRDIKPANILLESGAERVKITDFGLARAADDASLTQSGVIAGTPMYMAPEQALGETIDHRADLFSLGSVLYAISSGRPPFRASTTLGVLKRVTEDTPRPIREIIPEAPEWLCAIIAKLHAKKPEERFTSAKEVADLLAEPHGQGVPSPPDLVPKAERPRGERKPRPRWLVPAGAAVLIACLLLVAFLPAYWLRPSHGGPPADPKAPVVFRVEANQPWQDTGVDVAEGETVVLSPQGTWRKGEQTCSAAGLEGARASGRSFPKRRCCAC